MRRNESRMDEGMNQGMNRGMNRGMKHAKATRLPIVRIVSSFAVIR